MCKDFNEAGEFAKFEEFENFDKLAEFEGLAELGVVMFERLVVVWFPLGGVVGLLNGG